MVLGQFLVLKKSKDLFIDWLKDDAGANTKQATDCYQCLSGMANRITKFSLLIFLLGTIIKLRLGT